MMFDYYLKMKKLLLCSLAIILVAAASIIVIAHYATKPSEKEKVLWNVLTKIEIARGYERQCVAKSSELNALLIGNGVFVVAQLSEELAMHLPQKASDEIKLWYVQDILDRPLARLRNSITAEFDRNGCDSKAAQHAKKLYEMFSKVPPSVIFDKIQEESEKRNALKIEPKQD